MSIHKKNGKERTHIHTNPLGNCSYCNFFRCASAIKTNRSNRKFTVLCCCCWCKKNIQDFQVTDRSRRMCMSLLVLNHSIKRPMTFTTIHCVSRISWAPNPLIFVALFNKSFYDAYDARTYAFIGEIAFDRQYRFVVLCVQFPCPICCGQGERFFFLRSF